MVVIAEWLGGLYFDLLMALVMILGIHEWFTLCKTQTVIRPGMLRSLILVLGTMYIAFACLSLTWLRATHPDGAMFVLTVLLAVWASDTAAYFVGSTVGGPKLMPAISPKKTWSGLIGGMIGAALVGVGMAYFGDAADNVMPIVLFAIMIGVLAVVGDLIESFVKRRFGVKDSGSLIPGHGGILDRIDGLLAAAIGAAVLSALMPEQVELWP